MPKEEAERKYDDAIASGHNPTMMSRKTGLCVASIRGLYFVATSFELELGSIGPNQKLTVKIRCVSRLLYNKSGSVLFKFPAKLVPAYEQVEETKVNIQVNMSKEIEKIYNVPKSLQIEKQLNSCKIYGNTVFHTDLELEISLSPAQTPNLAILELDKENNTCAAMISFVLNKEQLPILEKQRKEFIFIVDRSGSMYVAIVTLHL